MDTELNNVTGSSRLGMTIILLLIIVASAFIVVKQYEKFASSSNTVILDELTVEKKEVTDTKTKQTLLSLLNGTYYIDNEKVTFVNGMETKEAVPGSASMIETAIFGNPIIGDLNGDGREDAVFMVSQETGGTGIFFYVLAAINKGNEYSGTNDIFLGDRIAPQNIRIVNGIIQVNYAIRRDNDPMTVQPSIGVTKYLQIKDGKLVEKGPEVNGY